MQQLDKRPGPGRPVGAREPVGLPLHREAGLGLAPGSAEGPQPVLAVGAAEAALLDAPEGQVGEAVVGEAVVEHHRPGLQPPGQPPAPVPIGGPDVGVQPVAGVVGQPDRLLLVVEGDHREDGTEGLLPEDVHLRGHVGQHRGLVEGALPLRPAAAGQHPGAPPAGVLHVGLHDVGLLGAGQGPQVRVGRAGAGPEPAGLLDGQLQEAVVDLPVHQAPLHRLADLARVEEGAPDRPRGGPLEVGVLQDDHGVLAAELQDHRRQVAGGALHHLPSGGHAAGKREHVHRRVHHRPARLTRPRGHLHEPRIREHLAGQLLQQQRAVGGELGGLQQHRVAGGQRRGRRARGDDEGEVPGRDDAGQAVGLGHHAAAVGPRPQDPVAAGRQHVGRVVGQPGQVVAGRVDLAHVDVHVGLAGLPGHRPGDLVHPLDDPSAEAGEERRPVLRGALCPGPPGLPAGPGHGPDLVRAVDRHPADLLAGVGLADGQGLPAGVAGAHLSRPPPRPPPPAPGQRSCGRGRSSSRRRSAPGPG